MTRGAPRGAPRGGPRGGMARGGPRFAAAMPGRFAAPPSGPVSQQFQ